MSYYKDKNKLNILLLFIISTVCIFFIHEKNLYIMFGHFAMSENFIDWEFVKGFAKCSIEGKNRFLNNDCDILNREVVYPPIWLHTPEIIYYIRPVFLFWFFFLILIYICKYFINCDSLLKTFLLVVTILSPPFLYAFQRLNIDLLILFFSFLIINYYFSKDLLKKIIADICFAFLVFLKIYPIALAFYILKENKFKIILVALSILIISILFYFIYTNEFQIMFGNKSMAGLPGSGTFAGASLFYFLGKFFIPNLNPHLFIFQIINVVLIALIFFVTKKNHSDKSFLNLEESLWIAGFCILLFCFAVGYNVNYRLIFILLLLPLFFSFSFVENKTNQKLMIIFFAIYFLRCHSLTLVTNILLTGNINFLDNFNTFAYDIYDSILQWLMITTLIIIFKKNFFHLKLFT